MTYKYSEDRRPWRAVVERVIPKAFHVPMTETLECGHKHHEDGRREAKRRRCSFCLWESDAAARKQQAPS